MISTGTPDRAVAKTAGAEIAANVEREFKALRDGPKALTAKHVSTLSGIAYRAFAEGLEDNPGLTSQQWRVWPWRSARHLQERGRPP